MTTRAATRRYLPNSPFKPPAPVVVDTFLVGEQVTHDRYGLGRVVGVEGERAVVVDFGGSRISLVTPFPKLSKLDGSAGDGDQD